MRLRATDWRRSALLAAGASLCVHGCSGSPDAEPRVVEEAIEDVAGPDTMDVAVSEAVAPPQVGEEEVGPAAENEPPLSEQPAERGRAVRSVPSARVQVPAMVSGSAEIEIGTDRFVPAEYFRVTLRGRGGQFETLTTQGGEFYLERVPAGTYVLELSMPKGPSVYADTVSIPPNETVTLPHLHVSLEEYERRKP